MLKSRMGPYNMNIKKYFFQRHGDTRGMLVAVEQQRDIPFEIKRVYYIYATQPDVRRGLHAHKTLEQVLICVHGSCKILLDDGTEKEIVVLDKSYEGLYVPKGIWREMYNFSPDTVLLVLASALYNEADYIRNYDEFLAFVKEGQ